MTPCDTSASYPKHTGEGCNLPQYPKHTGEGCHSALDWEAFSGCNCK